MFYESNCHRWEATCICRSTYWICIDISLVKTKNLNSFIYVSLEELRVNNMQRKSAIEMLQSWASVVFTSITFRVSISVSNINNRFLWRNDGEFWYIAYIIARGNVFYPCKIGRASYGVRLISYNAVRPMISYTDAGRRPPPVRYVTTQEKFLKNRPMPGRLSNSPVMRWNRTLSVLFVTLT